MENDVLASGNKAGNRTRHAYARRGIIIVTTTEQALRVEPGNEAKPGLGLVFKIDRTIIFTAAFMPRPDLVSSTVQLLVQSNP